MMYSPAMNEREIYEKMIRFCTYRERCTSEAKEKLKGLHVFGEKAERVLEKLTDEDFINEVRFARVYTGSRFRIKHWGKVKIRFELRKKGISEHLIQGAAAAEIDPTDYAEALRKLLHRKSELLKESDPFVRKQKLTVYALGKGYEPEIIREILNKNLSQTQ